MNIVKKNLIKLTTFLYSDHKNQKKNWIFISDQTVIHKVFLMPKKLTRQWQICILFLLVCPFTQNLTLLALKYGNEWPVQRVLYFKLFPKFNSICLLTRMSFSRLSWSLVHVCIISCQPRCPCKVSKMCWDWIIPVFIELSYLAFN